MIAALHRLFVVVGSLALCFPEPSNQANELASGNFNGAKLDSQLPLGLAEIVVGRPVGLKPFALESDLVGHGMQFVQRIREHVRHQHAPPVWDLSMVDVDRRQEFPAVELDSVS